MAHAAVHSRAAVSTPAPSTSAPRRRRRPPPLSVPPASLPTSFYPPPGDQALNAPSSAVTSHAAACTRKGSARRINEDRVTMSTSLQSAASVALPPLSSASSSSSSSSSPALPGSTPAGQLDAALYAVYDGHGGTAVAEFAARHVPIALTSLSAATPRSPMPAHLAAAFQQVDNHFCATADPRRVEGSTATVAVIAPPTAAGGAPTLHVAHVGDSRAMLLCHRLCAVESSFLTTDHTAARPEEAARVEASGGFVLNDRVNGILAVTRAIGDVSLKAAVVSDPDTISVSLSEHTRYLVLATDGLWDFVNEVDVTAALVGIGTSPLSPDKLRSAAEAIVDLAVSRGSADDISAVVIDLAAHLASPS